MAIAILVRTGMFGWSAEAAAKDFGYKQIPRNASRDITTQIIRDNYGFVSCQAFNKSYANICTVYVAYPVWKTFRAVRGTVYRSIPGKSWREIVFTSPARKPSARCKLISA